MDSDSNFEDFPCSQISFCGYENSQSFSYGGDIVDGETSCEKLSVVSLESNDIVGYGGETSGVSCPSKSRILYDNVAIEDIRSDAENCNREIDYQCNYFIFC